MGRERIHFVTENYYQLQGLRLVPLGLFLLALAASVDGWLSWLPGDAPHAQPRWLGLAFCLAVLGGAAATAYYRCRFGSIAQFGRASRNWTIGGAVILFIACAQVDRHLQAPIALAPLWMAAALTFVVWADGWIRAHYLVGAASWLLAGLVPALHLDPATRVVTYAVAGGLTLIICGLGDHRLIAHTLIDRRDVFGGTHPRTV